MFTVLQLLGLRPRTVFDSGVIGVHELSFHKLDSERRFACRENILMYHTARSSQTVQKCHWSLLE